jgi:hypothetical protein
VNEPATPPRDTAAPEIEPAVGQRVRTLYGRVLSEAEIREFCLFEQERPNWHAWPHVGWAAGTHIIYARREFSAMNVIVAKSMDELADKVDAWIAGRSERWMP